MVEAEARAFNLLRLTAVLNLLFVDQVSSRLCNGGHVCSPPKECCSFGCCYSVFPQVQSHISEMLNFLIWYYWYLWAALLIGLAIAIACGCWLWRRKRSVAVDDCSSSERHFQSTASPWYPPPHYSRCSSFVQALPPPYNEVTAKPDLYPLVIGYDEASGKGTSGFVMRYFRSLSHASTLDSLSSSFMCNMVNEANTIIPPPYSCNESIDELSAAECGRMETTATGDAASVASLANHRTASDISSLAAQSPCSPPRATSPTVERYQLRELLGKIQQLPHLPGVGVLPLEPQVLYVAATLNSASTQRPLSPGEVVGSCKVAESSGRMETGDVGSVLSLANHRTASDISSLAAQSPCSPPRATSPTLELRELLDKIQQLPHLPNVLPCHQNQSQLLYVTATLNTGSTQRPLSPGDHVGTCKARRTRGKMYMPLGLPSSKNKVKRWLSRSAPTTPSGTIPMPFLPAQSRRPSAPDNNNQQAVPLLSEQDETENNNADMRHDIPLLSEEQEEDRHQLT